MSLLHSCRPAACSAIPSPSALAVLCIDAPLPDQWCIALPGFWLNGHNHRYRTPKFTVPNLIFRTFVSRDITTMLIYVRPLLEYNSVVCSPLFKRDIISVEVQRKFTKRLPGYC